MGYREKGVTGTAYLLMRALFICNELTVYSLSLLKGALKTDHTEVLLSADFTGAIKVFINKKKYVS